MFLENFIAHMLEYNRYMNLFGLAGILLIAYAFSRKRSNVNMRLVCVAMAMHIGVAAFMLKTDIGIAGLRHVEYACRQLGVVASKGAAFLFGNLLDASGAWGFIFAFQVLPLIVFFGALMALLFYYGIVQFFVSIIARVMRPLLGTSGAETLCALAHLLLGQTEAPLLIRNYVNRMTRSEMMLVMVSGMAGMSGSILVVYMGMGVPAIHLLTSSALAIPASILISKILYPETEKAITAEAAVVETTGEIDQPRNVLDAVSRGTSDGLQLALNVGAMLVAFVALIALINALLGWGSGMINNVLDYFCVCWRMPIISLEYVFGYIFAPIGYLMGIASDEVMRAGELIGLKVVLNEMVAYGKMVTMHLQPRTEALLTYALGGFANFSSIGIQLGGIGALAPDQRSTLSELGFMALLGGTLANLLSAMVAGLFI